MTTPDKFNNVIFVGPSLDGRGGVEKLARLYTTYFENILYLPTNSPHGTFVGFFVLLLTCFRLPYYRFKKRNILHIHFASGKSFFRKSFVVFLGRCLKYKIVVHSHAGDFPEFVEKIGHPIAKTVLSMTDKIIVLSPYWRTYFENILGCCNVAVVPNFSLIEENIDNKKQSNEQRKTTFLYLGILTKAKGVDILLKAYKSISDCYVNQTRLIIAGSGPLGDQLKKLSDSEIKHGDVVFTGWIDSKACGKLLKSADIFVLPSKFECQPMSLIEAMIAGCGIIATRAGGIPDMIDDKVSGFLVEYGDVNALSDAMIRYIESPDLINSIAQKARARSNIYTPDNVAAKLDEIYSEVGSIS